MDIVIDGPTIVLGGTFDGRSTMEVRNAIYDAIDAHEGDVVIDLSDVTLVDVNALRVLAVATRYAARAGQRLTLRGSPPAVVRLLHLSHLIRVVALERVPA